MIYTLCNIILMEQSIQGIEMPYTEYVDLQVQGFIRLAQTT